MEPLNHKPKPQQFKTDGGKTKSNAIEAPSLSLPKGGGAIKGIDQKFTVNAVNGTAAFSIPLPASAARALAPSLSLAYNSGSGNGVFGLGWGIDLPGIRRKTDKELPQYNDADDSDTYVLAGAEDLVPEFQKNNDGSFRKDGDNQFVVRETDSPDTLWRLRYYKPRTEGSFSRIERWTHKTTQEIRWRVTTRDNITTLFGWSAASRLANPSNALQVFEWYPELVMDDKGNCTRYLYKAEDMAGFDPQKPHLRNRYSGSTLSYTNLYIDRILYGNKTPYFQNDPPLNEGDFLFQNVFDYGQYNVSAPYDNNGSWDLRADAFSDYKAGFEIRTTRLCKRILVFHYFDELPGSSALVKSLDFSYSDNANAGFTFLNACTSKGYIKNASEHYTEQSLPAMEFSYEAHQWNTEVKTISTQNLENAPAGLSQPYLFTDLYSEGLPGILSEQAGGWYYKRNLGNGNFEAAQLVNPKPAFKGLGQSLQLLDLDGDGSKQLVSFSKDPKGFFELGDHEDWQGFRAFEALPAIDLQDPNARLIDLNGDGKTDVLIAHDTSFTWYASNGRKGFCDYYRNFKAQDEEEGPAVFFTDSSQRIFLADMNGDGLTDIVRVSNSEVCYWPNLGYGRFGKKVTMDSAPVLDAEDQFDPAMVLLSDIDGSGTPDLIYLGKNKLSCWLNFSGNAFSTTPFEIAGFPGIHHMENTTLADLLGNGLSCIVWSSPLQKDAAAPLRYIDLMNSKKPHLLTSYKNNLGLEVEIGYTPSTHYYIADKLAGTPWVTRVHFPVHCVSSVLNRDRITGNTFSSVYSYKHGYYDHIEKEFRGFGRVDQSDAESTTHWSSEDGSTLDPRNLDQAPVNTRSWYHTGAYLREQEILDQFATEYWYEEMTRQGYPVSNYETALPPARIVPDDVINQTYVDNLTISEQREAHRACKGMALRSEVFSAQGNAQEQLTPYNVGTHNCLIELVQPKGRNKHAVYGVKESEAVTYSYERETGDPRITHTLNLETDLYGNILRSASVAYPRLIGDGSLPNEIQTAQQTTSIVLDLIHYTNDAIDSNNYRLRLPYNTQSFEINGLPMSSGLYQIADFDNVLNLATELAYSDMSTGIGLTARRIENVEHHFYKNSLSGMLTFGDLESLAIPYESYQMAYSNDPGTNDLVNDIYQGLVADPELLAGGYVQRRRDWYVRSGRIDYIDSGETAADAAARFYVPRTYTSPTGSMTKVTYDTAYHLYPAVVTDALNNTSKVNVYDVRCLMPVSVTDLNGNISVLLLDELALPKAMIRHKVGDPVDDLLGLTAETEDPEHDLIKKYFDTAQDPLCNSDSLESCGNALLQHATMRFVYDLHVYKNTGGKLPAVSSTIAREEHYQDNNTSAIQMSFEYSSGSGQVVMKKMQAEAGIAQQVVDNGDGTISVSTIDTTPMLRWIGNGRTVLNNKGNPVMQYEPYFSATPRFENEKELVEQGVTPLMYYDAPGRLIRTDFPDGTFSVAEFNCWKQISRDQNDMVAASQWYNLRINRLIDAELIAEEKDPQREFEAAKQTEPHYKTPTISHTDNRGRVVLIEELDEHGAVYRTILRPDIENNLRSVTDPRGNTVMNYQYDMLGTMVYQLSMDSGQRWMLPDCMGAPLYNWDERNHQFFFEYDALHRPLRITVKGGDGPTPLNNIIESHVYGEGLPNDALYNLRGNVAMRYDTGGMEEFRSYSFNNEVYLRIRTMAIDYKAPVDWNVMSGKLESDSYEIKTSYDALGRITSQLAPDGSMIWPVYNRRGLLVSEDVEKNGSRGTQLYNIEYDAKGQRSLIDYGNAVRTRYVYDKRNFRLVRLTTDRKGTPLQDLFYTYDPMGNITHKHDDNIPVQFNSNSMTSGTSEYIYDALYRLIESRGRESVAAATFGTSDNWTDAPYCGAYNSGDPTVMQLYIQNFSYDEAGNITTLQHSGYTTGSYTRTYKYDGISNRLLATVVGSDTYIYNLHAKHGYLLNMPHLSLMTWDPRERVVATSTQYVSSGTPETTYYQYDGEGKRLRKITENYASAGNTPTVKNSRFYMAGYEYYEDPGSGERTHTLGLIDNGQRYSMIEDSNTHGRLTRYQHPNHQSSAMLETDDSGNVITYEEYHAFGTTSFQATNAGITAAAKRYRYTGMERDEETGLSYHNARYYIPWLCRWANPDPIGIQDGLNVYAYCRNNPVNYTDSQGTQTEEKPSILENEHVGDGENIGGTLGPVKYDKLNFSLDYSRINDRWSLGGSTNFSVGKKFSGALTFNSSTQLIPDSNEDSELVQIQTRGYIGLTSPNFSNFKLSTRFLFMADVPAFRSFSLNGDKSMSEQGMDVLKDSDAILKTKSTLSYNDIRLGGVNFTLGKLSGTTTEFAGKMSAYVGGSRHPLLRVNSRFDFSTNSMTATGSFSASSLGVAKASGAFVAGPNGVGISGGFKVTAPPLAMANGRFTFTSNNGFALKSLNYYGVMPAIGVSGIGYGYKGVRTVGNTSFSFGAAFAPLVFDKEIKAGAKSMGVPPFFVGATLKITFN